MVNRVVLSTNESLMTPDLSVCLSVLPVTTLLCPATHALTTCRRAVQSVCETWFVVDELVMLRVLLVSTGGGHQPLQRVITLPCSTSQPPHPASSSSLVPDWVQRSVKFGPPVDRKQQQQQPVTTQSRLSVTDSLCHVPLSPQSSDASSGSADVDDFTCPGSAAAGMQGKRHSITSHH